MCITRLQSQGDTPPRHPPTITIHLVTKALSVVIFSAMTQCERIYRVDNLILCIRKHRVKHHNFKWVLEITLRSYGETWNLCRVSYIEISIIQIWGENAWCRNWYFLGTSLMNIWEHKVSNRAWWGTCLNKTKLKDEFPRITLLFLVFFLRYSIFNTFWYPFHSIIKW